MLLPRSLPHRARVRPRPPPGPARPLRRCGGWSGRLALSCPPPPLAAAADPCPPRVAGGARRGGGRRGPSESVRRRVAAGRGRASRARTIDCTRDRSQVGKHEWVRGESRRREISVRFQSRRVVVMRPREGGGLFRRPCDPESAPEILPRTAPAIARGCSHTCVRYAAASGAYARR